MRRELGQLWRTGWSMAARGATGSWSGSRRWSTGRRSRLLGEVYAAPVGRPSYGPVVLMKCLLLQQWYRLSDPGLEEALSDRLSFRRFLGLALADPVPDHSTLSRFRSELSRRRLAEQLLVELNRQLDAPD
jgi:transposase, IS5 family